MSEAAVEEPAVDPAADAEPEHVPDVEAILPTGGSLTILDVPCTVKPLMTREILQLLRILVAGLGSGLATVRFDFSDAAKVKEDLAALGLLALGNPMTEGLVFAFLSSLIDVELPPGEEADAARRKVVTHVQENPPIEDTVAILAVLAEQEAPNLVATAGKLQALFPRFKTLFAEQQGAKTTPSS